MATMVATMADVVEVIVAGTEKIAIAGGPAQTICDAPEGCGGSGNEQGTIIFAHPWLNVERLPF